MKNQYSRKDQIEEFVCSLRRALTFSETVPGYAYPKELSNFIQPLTELVKQANDLEYKYFSKQWKTEDDADFS